MNVEYLFFWPWIMRIVGGALGGFVHLMFAGKASQDFFSSVSSSCFLL